MASGKYNIYACGKGHMILTEDIDEGVTPFIIGCPIEDCGREMKSAMYKVHPNFITVMRVFGEWRKPPKDYDEDLEDFSEVLELVIIDESALFRRLNTSLN